MSTHDRYCRKRFFWRVKKFFSAAGASRARRCEGARRITRDRPQSFVRVLLRLAAAEATKNRLLRDFGSCSIFDFFDSIGPMLSKNVFFALGLIHSDSWRLGCS